MSNAIWVPPVLLILVAAAVLVVDKIEKRGER